MAKRGNKPELAPAASLSKQPRMLKQHGLGKKPPKIVEIQKHELPCITPTGFCDPQISNEMLQQTANALSPGENLVWAEFVTSTLKEIAPQTPLEGMLAQQMLTTHWLSLRFTAYAADGEASMLMREPALNLQTKLARTFLAQVETLHKLRHSGKQVIQVQHVNVNDGGQALIGQTNHHGET